MSELALRMQDLDREGLRSASAALRERATARSALSDDLVGEALAVAREAARRATGAWPSDDQVMHAARMQAGRVVGVPIAEGRGPVLMMAAYLHCLMRAPVHVVVVDDSLAATLATQLIEVMGLLGVTAAALSDSPDFADDRAAYRAEVVIGSSTRFCYDYLTDCLAISRQEIIQPSRPVAIIAEADIVLLDEATQRRVIDGEYAADARQYERVNALASTATQGVHYTYMPGTSRLGFTPAGLTLIQETLGVTDVEDLSQLRVVQQIHDAFIAKDWLQRGRDYEVLDGAVHPTPRLQRNARYTAGVLQSIEAKEDLFVSAENRPSARIRTCDYFRLYETLTGFASNPTRALAAELSHRYNLELSENPGGPEADNVPLRRREWEHAPARDAALMSVIAERHADHGPVVIATGSPETTTRVSQLLTATGIAHTILSPGSDHSIADGIANMGRPAAITVTEAGTGRGHDLPSPIAYGGPSTPMTVVGVGISRSVRVDQWLCAIAASNGGAGEVTFFQLRSDRIGQRHARLYSWLPARLRKRADGTYLLLLENRILQQSQDNLANLAVKARSDDDALTAVEIEHFAEITALRRRFLDAASPADEVRHVIDQAIDDYLAERPDIRRAGLLLLRFKLGNVPAQWATTTDSGWERVVDDVKAAAHSAYERQEDRLGAERMDELVRAVPLVVLAKVWREHLVELDILMQRHAASIDQPGSPARYEAATANRYATMLATFRELTAQHVLDPETLGP
jgi:preprotein translocase subunit SecA